MVLLMVSAAAAASAAAGGKKVFQYNRDNFLEDREQRRVKEFAERKFRVTQAELWREDVRSFVSLTEKKMSLYLLVGVLLLSFNVNLWVEGRLPEETPEWLTMGMQIAIAVSFLFLLLAVWLAMHAAVCAQAYQTRVLTQLVRLPIPSWEELDACRTSASDFERIEPRQMFRVPFVRGSRQQGDITREHAEHAALAAIPEGPAGVAAQETASANLTDAASMRAAAHESLSEGMAIDPWGLERSGGDTYELGEQHGESVAKLRHIKIMRQAAVYWQTYDAFARVSMSVGTNQLLLAMCYYILGYALAQARAPLAAWAGVSILLIASFLLAQVDLTLSMWEKHLFYLSLAFGPAVASLAVYRWSQHSAFAIQMAELLAPLAFISHGIVVGLMTLFVKVRTQENGAIIPLAFQNVLFLDVFGWVWHKHTQPEAESVAASEDWHTSAASTAGGLGGPSGALPASASASTAVERPAAVVAVAKARAGAPSAAPPSSAGSDSLAVWRTHRGNGRAGEAAGRHPEPLPSMPSIGSGGSLGAGGPDLLGYYADDYLEPADSQPSDEMRRQNSVQWDEQEGSQFSEGRHTGPPRPALACIAYNEVGLPQPTRPEDAKPQDSVQDFRFVSGAPRMWDQVNAIEPPGRGFWDPVSFMPPEDRERRYLDDIDTDRQLLADMENLSRFLPSEEIETGHDREAPGLVPWRIFQNAAGVTSLAWIFAGIYWMMRATHMFSNSWVHWLGVERGHPTAMGPYMDLGEYRRMLLHARSPGSLLEGSNATSPGGRDVDDDEDWDVSATWPYPSMFAQVLACDANGRNFVASDGVSLYLASIAPPSVAVPSAPAAAPASGRRATSLARRRGGAELRPEGAAAGLIEAALATSSRTTSRKKSTSANFAAVVGCAALQGEALDDAAIACGRDRRQCEVVVLHNHGRRVTSCLVHTPDDVGAEVPDALSSAAISASVAPQWLRHNEAIRWILLDTDCPVDNPAAGASVQAGCVSVGTTFGRIAQLQLSFVTGQLSPVDVFEAASAAQQTHVADAGASPGPRLRRSRRRMLPAGIRSLGDGLVGVLSASGNDLSLVRASAQPDDGKPVVARVRLPVSEAVGSFCVGGDQLYMLDKGPSPQLRHIPFPASVVNDLEHNGVPPAVQVDDPDGDAA